MAVSQIKELFFIQYLYCLMMKPHGLHLNCFYYSVLARLMFLADSVGVSRGRVLKTAQNAVGSNCPSVCF